MHACRLVILDAGLLALFVAGSLWVWPSMPDAFPIHFDLSGTPDRRAETTLFNWLLLPLLAIAIAALIHGIGQWVGRSPNALNMPNQERYDALPTEAKYDLARRAEHFLHAVAIGGTLLFATLQVASYQVAMKAAMEPPAYGRVSLWVFLTLGTVGFIVHMQKHIRVLEPPSSSR